MLDQNLELVLEVGAAVGSKVDVSVGWKFGVGVCSKL